MAYQTYITEALVCSSIDQLSSDRSFLLFTRELGMVYAYAKSVREERSKQRYALQECSHIRTTLVHGKSGWRCAGVEPIHNLYTHAESREARACVRNMILLLRRVIHGEVQYSKIFDDVISVGLHVNAYDPRLLEEVCTLRTLYQLGYVVREDVLAPFFGDNIPYEELTHVSESIHILWQQTIVHALTQSQL